MRCLSLPYLQRCICLPYLQRCICLCLPYLKMTTHSVNMHARSVLPIVYIGTLRACQQISADASQSVWADSRSDRIGPPHVQSVWAECHVSSALANGFPY